MIQDVSNQEHLHQGGLQEGEQQKTLVVLGLLRGGRQIGERRVHVARSQGAARLAETLQEHLYPAGLPAVLLQSAKKQLGCARVSASVGLSENLLFSFLCQEGQVVQERFHLYEPFHPGPEA